MKIKPGNNPPLRALSLCLLTALLMLLGGCGQGKQADLQDVSRTPLALSESEAQRMRINPEITPAADITALLAPYKQEMAAMMGEVLAYCPVDMRTGRPEGNIGALVADIMLHRARRDAPEGIAIEAALANNGGLRVSWSEGEITLGLVYELMPFDNEIYLLRFSGESFRSLVSDIAARGGEPVAGLQFTIRDTVAADITVGGEPISTTRDYWIATSDYLANGGGGMPTLWEPQEVVKTGVLIRTAIADRLREFGAAGGSALGEIPLPVMGRVTETGTRGGRNDY